MGTPRKFKSFTTKTLGKKLIFNALNQIYNLLTGHYWPILNDNWTDSLEVRLKETRTGRTILKVFRKHEIELFQLINKHRPVTLTWQRKQGPAFLAAFGRSLKYDDYKIPKEINRITPQNLLMSMAAVLDEHGSDLMREDIQQYSLDVLRLSKDCHSITDFFHIIGDLEHQSITPSSVNS